MTDAVLAQREYYARTAAHYESMHISDGDEHAVALALFSGFARHRGAQTVLDVGAGTGRAITLLEKLLPDVRITGVEPVPALRKVGHERGISRDQLIEGDALSLPFPDDSFDFVIETGVLHHVPEPRRAVEEMVRVARRGVMISDCNNQGQGSFALRSVKRLVSALGLWRAMIWVTTRGRMSKYSEGDGVYFSYSVFDDLAAVRCKFPKVHLCNTVEMAGTDPRFAAAQICLIAVKREA